MENDKKGQKGLTIHKIYSIGVQGFFDILWLLLSMQVGIE